MVTRVLLCTLQSSVNQNLIPRSFTGSYFLRFRPIVIIAAANFRQSSLAATNVCAFSTPPTTSSLNDSNPNVKSRSGVRFVWRGWSEPEDEMVLVVVSSMQLGWGGQNW
ncbi:hypothetical protein L1987_86108 [Smallanthus sonchifolius]|uniref:Uncharacterized protein n=1 Tax=Smallanthus sonchifolius TaxID=185202 RepID=A0ACB8XZ29_9ASTR|nr:hypothetical protein L1987_86108 [Smallanthus sonchifolius]